MFSIRLVVICLFSLSLAVSCQAQNETEKAPSLNDAKTMQDVFAYLDYEGGKLNLASLNPKERAITIAGLLMPASEKLLEIATTTPEKAQAHNMRISALTGLVQEEIEGAEQQLETFLDKLATQEGFERMAEMFRFRFLMQQMMSKGTVETEQKFENFLKELDAKEKDDIQASVFLAGRFFLFGEKAKKAEVTPANFDKFKTEWKGWFAHLDIVPLTELATLGFNIAYRHKVPTEQIVKELSEHIQTLPISAEEKKSLVDVFQMALRLAPGVDPKLYGKTLDDKDFNWQSLRGKYVLIKFTATWCGPCKMQIPDLLEAYNKYKDKGLEIVSVYMWERGADPVATVKQSVEEDKLPWIILSEALTVKAGQPEYQNYGIRGVPTIVLVDKEGKIMPLARENWKKKLAEIFE